MNDLSSDSLLEMYRTNASIFFSLASETLDGAQKLADLNLQVGRSLLTESAAYLREIMPAAPASETVAVAVNPASTDSDAAQAAHRSVQSVLETAQTNVSNAAAGALGDAEAQPGEQD